MTARLRRRWNFLNLSFGRRDAEAAGRRGWTCRSKGLRREELPRVQLLIFTQILGFFVANAAHATGFYGPNIYLSEGGRLVDASPEFYWELEVKRLSKGFRPQEKFIVTAPMKEQEIDTAADWKRARLQPFLDATAAADDADFKAALDGGEIQPADRTAAIAQHRAARAAVSWTASAPPDEVPSEFSDYNRGALDFRRGEAQWDDARKAWEMLLARPEGERRYRTVWAAFMLGKLALKRGQPDAVAWFEKTREFAKRGFVDSLGLAADSYGWQGRSEWKQGHPEKAASLFLTQLAMGDQSAIVSLKALIPDREPVGGILNYRPDATEDQSDVPPEPAETPEQLAALGKAAGDPLLRRLVTAHILCMQSTTSDYVESQRNSVRRASRWLATVEGAKFGAVGDAEYLAWIAYGDGKYDQAARWLHYVKGETPAALWLHAKLERRAGKLDEALRDMGKAWQIARDPAAYTNWVAPDPAAPAFETGTDFERTHFTFEQSASGDLAGLHLSRAEFVETLDAFVTGGLWDDAAYIAERVLTTKELQAYVDAHPPDNSGNKTHAEDPRAKLSYLLGRRLVREDRNDDARRYLPSPYDKVVERYADALRRGADAKLAKAERARALFTAAWIARYDGMELMGTEGAPDGFVSGGSFEELDLATERRTGVYVKTSYEPTGSATQKTLPIPLRPTKKELNRINATVPKPNARFHYRMIAGALAMRAAQLLPDQTPELADVINRAGLWVKDRDEPLASRYYATLEERALRTPLGQATIEKHWFVDGPSPWSGETRAAFDAMHKEFGIQPPLP